jgi:hypothetical protein
MGIKFTNFATSTIANVGGIALGDTSVDVQAGDGALFHDITGGGSDYFYCVLVDSSGNREVVKCTGRSTDTLTIVRAQDGTSARAFDQDDVIELRLNKSALEEFADVVADLTTHLASDYHFPAATIMIFGQSSAPTGWTRKADWTNNAMLCYAASGSIASGGSANPQSSHSHTSLSHTHSVSAHTHTVASQTLSTSQIPSHSHTVNAGIGYGSGSGYAAFSPTYSGTVTTSTTGGGTGHDHGGATGTSGTLTTESGGTGATGENTAPYYQEVIAASKDAYT